MSKLHLEEKIRKMSDSKRKIRTLQVPVVYTFKNVKLVRNSILKQIKTTYFLK